jgi:NAD(P)-dependent dehydrogenase (short-subunit alcohol dehydrogenase family)
VSTPIEQISTQWHFLNVNWRDPIAADHPTATTIPPFALQPQMEFSMASTSSSSKVALVTGASSGMGKETAKRLMQEGLVVYVAARRIDQMEDLRALGAIPLKMDITVEEDVVAAVKQVQAMHGGIDVLVNNAGFGMYGSMEESTIDDARYQFDVNLFGMARLTQLALPAMRKKGAGTIINISSMGGKIYTPLGSWYHATKHAVEGWSDCLRIELAPFGIHVVIIEPGAIATEWGNVMLDPMLKRSGHGPYQALAQAMAKAMRSSYGKEGSASPPSVVADAILQAVRARRPKTRYVMGKLAKPLLFIRKYFGDRVFDMAIMSQAK